MISTFLHLVYCKYPEDYIIAFKQGSQKPRVYEPGAIKVNNTFREIKKSFANSYERKKLPLDVGALQSDEQERALYKLILNLEGINHLTVGHLRTIFIDYAANKMADAFEEDIALLAFYTLGLKSSLIRESFHYYIAESVADKCKTFSEVDYRLEKVNIREMLIKFLTATENEILIALKKGGAITPARIVKHCDDSFRKFPGFIVLRHLKAKAQLWENIQKNFDPTYLFEDVWKWGLAKPEFCTYEFLVEVAFFSGKKKKIFLGQIDPKDDLKFGSLYGLSVLFTMEVFKEKFTLNGLTEVQERKILEAIVVTFPGDQTYSVDKIYKGFCNIDEIGTLAQYFFDLENTLPKDPDLLLEKLNKEPLDFIIVRHLQGKFALWNEIKREYPHYPFEDVWKWELDPALNLDKEKVEIRELNLLVKYHSLFNKTGPAELGSFQRICNFLILKLIYDKNLWSLSKRMEPLGLSLEKEKELENELIRTFKTENCNFFENGIKRSVENWNPMEVVSTYLSKLEKELCSKIPSVTFLTNLLAFQPDFIVGRKLFAQLDVFEAMKNHKKGGDFPFQELWRYAIDGKYEDFGPYYFENELGYIVGWLTGLKFAMQTNPLSPAGYIQLHDCIASLTKSRGSLSPFPLGLRRADVEYSLATLDQDPIGIEDLVIRPKMEKPLTPTQFRFIETYVHIKGRQEKEFLEAIFHIYYKKTERITKAEERFLAALWLVRELEVNHVFADGNGRTSITALLGFLWNDPELPMALFHDPNILDGNGPEKLCYRGLEAMLNFKCHGKYKGKALSFDTITLSQFNCPDLNDLRDALIPLVAGKSWEKIHQWML